MAPSVGDFVKISGLTSDGGRSMNGKIGIARAILSERGRVGVEILGKKDDKPETFRAEVSIKYTNLKVVASEDGYELLDSYLINKMYDAKDTKVQLEALQERFEIPGFSATWRDNATMVSMLRLNDRVKESLAYSEKCLEQVPRAEPQRNTLLQDYAECLHEVGQLKESLNATMEIEANDDYKKKIKLDLLENISDSCAMGDDEIKEVALRALMNMVLAKRKVEIALELGGLLCRRSLAQGVKFYEKVIASGITDSSLEQALSFSRSQASSRKCGGR